MVYSSENIQKTYFFGSCHFNLTVFEFSQKVVEKWNIYAIWRKKYCSPMEKGQTECSIISPEPGGNPKSNGNVLIFFYINSNCIFSKTIWKILTHFWNQGEILNKMAMLNELYFFPGNNTIRTNYISHMYVYDVWYVIVCLLGRIVDQSG